MHPQRMQNPYANQNTKLARTEITIPNTCSHNQNYVKPKIKNKQTPTNARKIPAPTKYLFDEIKTRNSFAPKNKKTKNLRREFSKLKN